eukprot:6975597-Karenia_brevis.AAC.1
MATDLVIHKLKIHALKHFALGDGSLLVNGNAALDMSLAVSGSLAKQHDHVYRRGLMRRALRKPDSK